ncbi:hypothetical protein LOTGIDRAFT_158400 [Lottia gigantea]|uniref:Uncharacterized protein n=1 Tax=Lottia gigantea TaxID=225164 RepID=V4CBR7_LOTGI|nr:hypothetical protein LOTGIDRAFT_158400 [Lottia gigantea]ESO99319.1 hypothetical protein LOTGIDRAFT_158400 [Lottia gigantea]
MANKFGLGSLPLETKKPNTTAWINKAKPYFVDQIGDTLQGDLDMNNFKVKVDSIFFRQNSGISSNRQFNARKVLQFINGTENVETKEYEINEENSKFNHLYIKTSGKYIDRFRMLIIPVKENDTLSLSEFDMILLTETPPSSYDTLFAWDCETYSESKTRKAIPYCCTLVNMENLRKKLETINNLFPDLKPTDPIPEEFYNKLMTNIVEIFVGKDCIDHMLKYLGQYDRRD